jgi:hypothetical protein
MSTPTVNQHVSKNLRAVVKKAVKQGWTLEFATGAHNHRCVLRSPDGNTVITLSAAGSHSGGPTERIKMSKIRRAMEVTGA